MHVHRWQGTTDRQPLALCHLARTNSEIAIKTQGEIEAAICNGITQFDQDYKRRGPKQISAHLIGDLLLVRLQGVLTTAEHQLVKTLPSEKGRDLLKQVRTQLIETARPVLEKLVLEITGVKIVSLHHDISVMTGEEVILFTLAQSPLFRETKKK
jgi:uncharacterized protein YbcI